MDNNVFIIPLNGLAAGKTCLEASADKEFFKGFDNTEILDADLDVRAVVEKSGQYVGVDCDVCGDVVVPCDRCLEPLTLPVDVKIRLSVKYGQESEGEDEADRREVVYLPMSDADLDLGQIVYDYICLSLPLQRFHEEKDCNPQVLKYLQDGISVTSGNGEESVGESPFAALQGLFEKK